jgi:uncharacterized protein involved in exopolysaccharide biosynthesis
MAEALEMTMDDYLAMVRRRLKVVIIPVLLAPIAGYLISYALPTRYQSTATVQVLSAKLGSSFVEPVITHAFADRVNELSGRILSSANLQQMVRSVANLNPNLVKPGEEAKLVDDIRGNVTVLPVISAMTQATAGLANKNKRAAVEAVPSVSVSYIDSNPERAQKICDALANQIVNQDLNLRVATATETQTFLNRQVADAKADLDTQDAKMAEFKKRYAGQLPGDLENNMKVLMSVTQQLDTTTQNLNRAQQDKTYAESMLAQQIAAWKNSQSSANPQTLEQQLAALQAQLLQLQARYTDDYPDVIKTKADIAQVQARLDQINKQTANSSATSEKASANEPPEIRQLRLQIHQYQQVIDQATTDQKKLQASINAYQSRTSMSPEIEEQWNVLSRDYATKQKIYNDLLQKQSSADLGQEAETHAEGEQVTIGQPASRPETPTFPNRSLCAAGGLGAGLALGLLIAIWLEFSDKSIRTERDASVAMDLPLLISVPWIGEGDGSSANGYGKRGFWGHSGPPHKDEEKIGV